MEWPERRRWSKPCFVRKLSSNFVVVSFNIFDIVALNIGLIKKSSFLCAYKMHFNAYESRYTLVYSPNLHSPFDPLPKFVSWSNLIVCIRNGAHHKTRLIYYAILYNDKCPDFFNLFMLTIFFRSHFWDPSSNLLLEQFDKKWRVVYRQPEMTGNYFVWYLLDWPKWPCTYLYREANSEDIFP